VWASAKSLSEVKSKLEEMSSRLTEYSAQNALVLNPAKTQLLLVGKVASDTKRQFEVRVGDTLVRPGDSLDLLGISVDCKLSLVPHIKNLAKAAKAKAALVKRLTFHLPRGRYLKQLATGLLLGKVSYAAPAVVPVRLNNYKEAAVPIKEIQVAINDVARSVTGKKLQDKIQVSELLAQSGLPSYNRLAVSSLAMEVWKAWKSNDGPTGERNPLGKLIFGDQSTMARQTRAGIEGCIPPPLPVAASTLAYFGYQVWNDSAHLRAANTMREAKLAAKTYAQSVPL